MATNGEAGEEKAREAAEAFLAVAGEFRLGDLDTERQHPQTMDLSRLAREDPAEGVRVLHGVDVGAWETLGRRAEPVAALAAEIGDTLAAGGRVYLCGCGATGRLSLSLERFCRDGLAGEEARGRVTGFMAGGDAALIRAVERFEDRPDYGARQLEELGFGEEDLLLGITEGGETPFVIGATERAAALSRRAPFFLYGNPDAELAVAAERSRRVLEDPGIRKLFLGVGPMALSGSTRMQASTVLMAAAGAALAHWRDPERAPGVLREFGERWAARSLAGLEGLVRAEAEVYQRGEYVLYDPGDYGITVLTDTTERSPTFSLLPFENGRRPEERAALCYLHLRGTPTAGEAWRAREGRAPRTLEWPEVAAVAGREALLGYDFSDRVVENRRLRTGGAAHHAMVIDGRSGEGAEARLRLGDAAFAWAASAGLLWRHLEMKMVLNIHSTLVMGRLGRYADNLMTYVSPSNGKLVDRAVRYVRLLLQRHHGLEPGYAEVARCLFALRDRLAPDEPLVVRAVEAFVKSGAGRGAVGPLSAEPSGHG